MCQPKKNIENSMFDISVALNFELMKTLLLGPINCTFVTWCVNPKTPLKLVCLANAWLGTSENKAFWGPITLPSQHDVPTLKKPLKAECLALAWLGTNENTAFRDHLPYLRNIVNPKKSLKQMCLALVWLGTDENKQTILCIVFT